MAAVATGVAVAAVPSLQDFQGWFKKIHDYLGCISNLFNGEFEALSVILPTNR